jgi:hypothetical protein
LVIFGYFWVEMVVFRQTAVIGHFKTTDKPVNRLTENENKSQRFDKIKRGASQHTVAPHLILLQRTSTTTNDYKF